MPRLFIFTDVRLYRESLERYLSETLGFAVAGSAADRRTPLRRVEDLRADVVLVDMSMPDAIGLCRDLAARGLRVVALGLPADEETMFACAGIGVNGYVCRAASLEDLRKAVTAARGDAPYCDDWVSAFALRCMGAATARFAHAPLPGQRDPAAPAAPLTRREAQVARLFGEGLSNKEIARRLSIEVSTVKNHVHHVLSKLGARSRSEASHILARPGGLAGEPLPK